MRSEKIKNGIIVQALDNIHHSEVDGKATISYEAGAVTIFNGIYEDPDNQIGPTARAFSSKSPKDAWEKALEQVKTQLPA